MTAANPLGAGSRLGDYVLDAILGKGSMGVVYSAVHTGLHRPAAVKILPGGLSADKSNIERFTREARIAARLKHPNVVSIYDANVQDGTYYIAMELIEGETLKSVVRRTGRLEPSAALRVIRQAANGLGAAHAIGIIHRDVKPENIMITKSGHVKVLDFGIAKTLWSSSTHTATGAALGTPRYMSPEQCRSEELTAQSDIYSLGVVMFEMLTGTTPFEAQDSMSLMLKIANNPVPPLRSIQPDLPSNIETVVANATGLNPNERYASCIALANDIGKIIEDDQCTIPRRTAASNLLDEDFSSSGLKDIGLDSEPASDLLGPARPTGSPQTAPDRWRSTAIIGTAALFATLILATLYFMFPFSGGNDQVQVPDRSGRASTMPETSAPEALSQSYEFRDTALPVRVGTRWVYSVLEGGQFIVEVINVIEEDGVRHYNTKNIEPPAHGNTYFELLSCDSTGLRIGGAYVDDVLYAKKRHYWFSLEYPLVPGKRWVQERLPEPESTDTTWLRFHFFVDGEETIRVPAGDFRCMRIYFSSSIADPSNPNVQIVWINPDVGIVKWRRGFGDAIRFNAELLRIEQN